MLAWHFTAEQNGIPVLLDGRSVPPAGEWLVQPGKLEMCKNGLHASEKILDALKYAPGNILHQVEIIKKGLKVDKDKVCARRRKVRWSVKFDTLALVSFAEICVTRADLAAFSANAASAASAASASSAAWEAASAASAAREASSAAWEAASAAREAARAASAASAAREAARAAREAARAARVAESAVSAADYAARSVSSATNAADWAATARAAESAEKSWQEETLLLWVECLRTGGKPSSTSRTKI